MRKLFFVGLLALVVCGAAKADLSVDISTSGGPWPYSPYIISPVSGPDVPNWMPASFETFCVERDQTFSPGRYLATIDTDIMYVGGSSPVTLDDEVKKIYAAYLNNQLGSFSGNVIQESIWGAQGYSGYSINSGINSIIGSGDISGWNDVKVLNLWSGAVYTGTDKQSQLVMTPIPGAFLLGMLGLSVAGIKLRKYT